jgi:hypothetical protein
MLLDFWVQSARAGGFLRRESEHPATSATRKGGLLKLDSVLVQGALLIDMTGSRHEGRFLPESLNGGCRSS